MDPSFPDWFALVALKPSPDLLAKRWAAVETLAATEGRSRLLSLVRVARGSDGDTTAVVKAARDADESFQSHDAEAELRLLSAVAISQMTKTESAETDLVALAVVTSSFSMPPTDALAQRTLEVARQYLAKEGLRVRQVTRVVGSKAEDFTAPITTFSETATSDPGTLKTATTTLLQAITKIHATAIQDLQTAMSALREESDMVWWSFSGYSTDFDQPLRDLGLAASCLVAAKELADLTKLLPGPRSAAALLDRTLAHIDSSAATVVLVDAVNGADRDWRKAWTKNYVASELRELAPVMFATARSLETDSLTDWVSAFTKGTRITDAQIPPPALAFQAYNESLVLRALAAVNA